MAVGGYLGWSMANNLSGLSKEALSRVLVPVLREHRIDQVAVSINGSVEVAPFAPDPNVSFVDILGATCHSLALCPQLLGDQWSEAYLPISNCFVSELETSH